MSSKFEINKYDFPFYIAIIFIFISLKIVFSIAQTDNLLFLLKPTNKIIEIITGNNSVYIQNEGFFYENFNIIINKSCSGFNFFVICFVLLSISVLKFFKSLKIRILSFTIIFLISYLFTLFVNTSRIILSIVITKNQSFELDKISWLHQVEGAFIYLFFLVIIYLLFEFLMKKISLRYEKFT